MFQIPVIIGTYPILDELYSTSTDDRSNERSDICSDSYLPNAPSPELCRYPSNLSLSLTELPPYPDEGRRYLFLFYETDNQMKFYS